MNQSPEQDPATKALLSEAAADEQTALTAYLQNRVVILNAEVRRRDQIIQSLEAEVAALQGARAANDEAAKPHDPSSES